MQIGDDDADFAKRAQPIWHSPSGSALEAKTTMEDPDAPGNVVFTADRRNRAIEMRPLRPSVVVKDVNTWRGC